MSQHKTGVRCPVCKDGEVVVEVKSVPTASIHEIPIGPGSRSYFRSVATVFCSGEDCQVLFQAVPGNPKKVQEILQSIRNESQDL